MQVDFKTKNNRQIQNMITFAQIMLNYKYFLWTYLCEHISLN